MIDLDKYVNEQEVIEISSGDFTILKISKEKQIQNVKGTLSNDDKKQIEKGLPKTADLNDNSKIALTQSSNDSEIKSRQEKI